MGKVNRKMKLHIAILLMQDKNSRIIPTRAEFCIDSMTIVFLHSYEIKLDYNLSCKLQELERTE